MTARAVIIGLICAAAVCGFCYFNDFVMRQTFLVGNYMPISVYGGLLLFLLLVNPLLRLLGRRAALSGRELAVIVALTLAACYVPGRGLMHYFLTFLILPRHYARTTSGWKEVREVEGKAQGVVDMAPERMLAGIQPPYRHGDILDGPAFCERLIGASGSDQPSPARRLWELLPEDATATAQQLLSDAPEARARQAKIVEAINAVLEDPAFYTEQGFRGLELPTAEQEWLEGGIEGLTDSQVLRLNRALLVAGFPRAIRSRMQGTDGTLASEDVLDWSRLASKLQRQGRRSRPSVARRLWGLLPEDIRAAVAAMLEAAEVAERRQRVLIGALNQTLGRRDLYQQAAFAAVALPDEARELLERDRDELSPSEVMTLNRLLLDAAFPQELRSLAASEDLVLNGFVQGLGVGDEHIAPSDIPWHGWTRTLWFWLPLLMTFSVGMIALALVVHRQWADHEQLPYPIVTFAHSLLPQEGQARGGVFRNKLFWLGLGIVLVIHLNNYACQWWPRYLVQIPRYFDFRRLSPLFPALRRGGDWALMNPTLYFTAIGFAFFLATDVSLSLGLAAYVYAIVVGILAGYGVAVGGGGFISLNIQTFLFGGAYFGMFLVLLYTGRHYYLSVLRRVVLLPARGRVEGQAVWGARVFLAAMALFAVQLMGVGLNWYLAILYTAGAVLIFTVISRLVSETGVFFIHAYHFPCVLLWGFLGARVLGPEAMLIMFMVTSLLLIDPRESVMPFFTQGLKLADLNRVKLGKVASWGAVALAVGFAIAVPVTLYWLYDKGSGTVGDGWTRGVPRMSFDATVRVVERLKAQGELEQAGQHRGLGWFRNLTPNSPCVLAFGISMGLVLLFAAARLRFPRWPLHPVMFLILGTFQSRTLAFSFLVGCLIKVLVTKYGGASGYQKLKPMMIGVIAGDMLGGLIPMIIGAVYWGVMREPPKRFVVLPL